MCGVTDDGHVRGVRLAMSDRRCRGQEEIDRALVRVVDEVGQRFQSAGETLPQDGLHLGLVKHVRDQDL